MSASTQSYSTAFSLSEYIGSSTLGGSRAGGAAVAEDATTVFTNPAGLTRLSGNQWLVATQIFAPSVKFQNSGASTDAGGVPISGSNGGDAGVLAPALSLYYAKSLSDQRSFGFGFNSPFGLTVDYDRDWVGRYQVVKSELMDINLKPSVGFKINEALSIGAGVSMQYVRLEQSSAIDFGA